MKLSQAPLVLIIWSFHDNFVVFLGCYDIGGSDIGGSDIGGPDIGGFLATLEVFSKKDIGGLVTLEAC